MRVGGQECERGRELCLSKISQTTKITSVRIKNRGVERGLRVEAEGSTRGLCDLVGDPLAFSLMG